MPIKFRCPSCNSTLTAPDKYAGGTAKCQSCQTKVRIPKPGPHAGDDPSSATLAATSKLDATDSNEVRAKGAAWSERRIVGTVVGTAVTLLAIFASVLFVIHHVRDKERAAMDAELDHANTEAGRLVAEFRFDKALAQFDQIAVRIRESPLADTDLTDRLDDALAQVRRAELDYESKTAAGWEVFEGRLMLPDERRATLEQRRRVEEERRREEERRIVEEKARRSQEELLAQAMQSLSAAERLEQDQDYRAALEKFQHVIEIITKQHLRHATSSEMLAQAEAGIKRVVTHLSLVVEVIVMNKALADACPRWSADHELRVNGRVVDKITNDSPRAEFANIEIKPGDKITARSMWKNGYGAVGTVFDYSPRWPTTDTETTTYYIILYSSESMYRAIENK